MPNNTDVRIYLSDLQEYAVQSEANADGTFAVRGLPILKPGTWNGVPFETGNLDDMIRNHEQSRDELAFEPPLRPFHAKPGDRVDARRDILGNISRLYRDGDALLADATVYDADTIEQMKKRRYRYLSSEVRINPAGPDGRTSLRGLAFVDDPAVKGMDWRLVMNSADYEGLQIPDVETDGGVQDAPAQKGEITYMSKIIEGIKGLLHLAEAEDVALPEPPAAPAETPEVVLLREQYAQLKADGEAAAEAVVKLRADSEAAARAAKSQTLVDALLADRYIVPAQTAKLQAIMLALPAEQTVMLAEGAEAVPAMDALVTVLREGAQIAQKNFAQISDSTSPELDAEAKAKRMAAASG